MSQIHRERLTIRFHVDCVRAGVAVPGDSGAQRLFALAAERGIQVRHLRPSIPTLEDVFAQAVGEK